MASKDGRPWCLEPFTTLESKVWGDWGLCCRSRPLEYNARDVSPLEHFNSETMKRIRKDMLDHNITEEIQSLCFKCIEHERCGVGSRRQQVSNTLMPPVNNDGSIDDFKFRSLEIKFFGNLCNLKCRMCGPLYSSSIAAEQKKSGEWDGPVHHNTWREYDSSDKQKFFEDMAKVIPCTNVIKFTGGEPMMNQSILDFVEWIVNQDLAKNLTLKIITNGTQMNQYLLTLSRRFKRFHAMVSVDGGFEVDEYQRPGTYFEDVINNIQTFKQYGDVVLTTAITAINVGNLHEIRAIANSLRVPIDQTSVVLTPEYLQVKVLPPAYRQQLLSLHSFTPEVKKALEDPEWPVDLWEKFKEKNKDIFELIPELKQYDTRT